MASTSEMIEAFNSLLAQYGLGGLSGWIVEAVTEGKDQLTILTELRQKPEYKARFPAMAVLQQKAQSGTGVMISEMDYLNMEAAYRQKFQAAGLPANMWDSPDDYKRLIENDVSPDEVEERISAAKVAVDSTDPAVRQQLLNMYGLTTTDLMAYALDPSKNSDYIRRISTSATLAGYGSTAGLAGANWQSYAQDLVNQQAGEADIRQSIYDAKEIAESQIRLAGIEGGTFSANDALDIAVRKDAKKTLASRKRVEREKARFSSTSGVSTGSLKGSSI